MEQRTQTFADLVKGYLRAADLADRRCGEALKRGDKQMAAIWTKAGKHFAALAVTAAGDDAWVAALRGMIERRADHRRLTDWTLATLELCLGHLSGAQRVVYELVESGPVDVKDAAAALGINPNQVRQHLSRARQTMTKVRDSIAHLIPPRDLWYLQRKAS